jgi:hypothetical protein
VCKDSSSILTQTDFYKVEFELTRFGMCMARLLTFDLLIDAGACVITLLLLEMLKLFCVMSFCV